MINQAFAARYLAGVDPVGQRLAIGSPDQQRPWTTIVGVVADYRNNGVTQPVRPEIYIPVRQQTAWNQLFMLVRTDGARRRACCHRRARPSRRSIPNSRST